MSQTIAVTELPFPLVRRGKVRDVYDVGDDRLLIVATDRISAFDVVMPQPIPDKGAVLTQITAWWLRHFEKQLAHHMLASDADAIVAQDPPPQSRAPPPHRRRTTPIAACASAPPAAPAPARRA